MNFPSDDLIQEQAYLVARRLRPLAIVAEFPTGQLTEEEILMAYNEMQKTANKQGGAGGQSIIPVAFIDDQRDALRIGFAASSWVPDTLKWISENAPQPHLDRLLGLLLGYSADSIALGEDEDSGRLFTLSFE